LKEVNFLIAELGNQLTLMREKPYLPFWGEIYGILFEFKKIAKKAKQNIEVYQINAHAKVLYDYKNDRFTIQMPGLNITLKDNELVDSLILGRFHPF
jgi:spore coat protein CotF